MEFDNLMLLCLLISTVGSVIYAFVIACIAKKKNRRFGKWFIYGMFLPVIALVHASLLSSDPREQRPVKERVMDFLTNPTTKMVITLILIIIIIVIVFNALGLFDSGSSDGGDGDEWHICTKCGGSGKVRTEAGFKVSCTRCNGVGYIPY